MSNDPLDPNAQAEREKIEKDNEIIKAFHEEDDFKWLMSDERGRRFVWGILERSGLFSLPYDGTGEGAIRAIEVTNEARLAMGLIFAHCPGAFELMIKEREVPNDDRK
jgi:hypothetical protein